MLPAILLGLMGTLLLAAPASSDPIFVDARSVGSAEMPRFEVVSRTDEGVELLFELPALVVEEVPIEGSAFRSVEIPGGGLIGEAGHPALPVFTRFVAIPDRAAVRVEASVESSVEWSGFDLAPMPPDDGADIVRDETAYRVEGYPTIGSAEAGEPAIARDLRLVPLTIRPVRYDPAGRSLAVDERIRIRVSFEGEDPTNARRENARRSVPPSYDRLYRELVVNYEEPPRGMPIEMGGYLVICPDDAGVVSRLQPLLDWRKRQGYEVVLATTSQTGTTAEQIKSYIQNAYDTWDPAPEFVVLAGDATTPYRIRCFYETLSGYGGEGDHPYTQLEGGDVLADCHIGRLSFSSLTELETIVAKIVGYETAPYIEDPTWFNRACLVGDPYDSGYSTVIVQQWIKRRLLAMEYAEIDTIFNSPFVSRMTPALNRGNTIFSYRGIYGMSGRGLVNCR